MSTTVFNISPTSTPVNSNVTVQAIPDVTLIAAVISPLVILILIATVAVPVITMCLCRKKGNELQQQDVYYSEVELPPLPPRNTTMKRSTDPQYWTIDDIKESQTKPLILQSADNTDSRPRPTHHEAEANHNHHVQEQDLDQSCVTVTSDGLSHYSANNISHPDVANITGGCRDNYGGETAIIIPLTDIQLVHCTSVAIAPDILENSKSQSTRATAITAPLTENQACGANITTKDVETNANVAYSCNDKAFAVIDNPAYNTNIAIAPDVSTQENVAYNMSASDD